MAYATTDLLMGAGQKVPELESVIKDMEKLLKAIEDALEAANRTSGKLVRTLAGFDRLERLGKATGGSSISTGLQTKLETVSEALRLLTQTLPPAKQGLEDLAGSLDQFDGDRYGQLEHFWNELLQPMGQQVPNPALAAFITDVAQSLGGLDQTVQTANPAMNWLLNNCLLPMSRWTGGTALGALALLRQRLDGVSDWADGSRPTLEKAQAAVWGFLSSWSGDQVSQWLRSAQGLPNFLSGLGGILDSVTGNTGALRSALGLLGGATETAWQSMQQTLGSANSGFKDSANGIIGIVNGALSAVIQGFNSAISSLNGFGISIPEWVPEFGGKAFQIALRMLPIPKIPFLAQGAVLPANRPFLAMVGDQRHGTNVEAPLSTIQEAVAAVMADQTGLISAGFDATVDIQRQLLEAVLGIRIGDETIARAAEGYARKMAVVRGGQL